MINERLEDIANGLILTQPYKIICGKLVIKLNRSLLLSISIRSAIAFLTDAIHYVVKVISTGNLLDEGLIYLGESDNIKIQDGNWIDVNEESPYKGTAMNEVGIKVEHIIPNTLKELEAVIDFYTNNIE